MISKMSKNTDDSIVALSNEYAKALFIGVPAVLLTSLGFYMAISGLVVIFLELAL
jgi:hypothetical protein